MGTRALHTASALARTSILPPARLLRPGLPSAGGLRFGSADGDPVPRGRYELRGDGVTTPYVWAWIPNPPPPPPPAAPPPAEPPASIDPLSPAAVPSGRITSAGPVRAPPRLD